MAPKSTLVQYTKKNWKRIERILNSNGFKTTVIESERSLRKFIYDSIPNNCIVGLGNSLSSSGMKIREILLEKGNKIYYNWNGTAHNRSLDTFEDQPRPDFFLTTAETITEEGKLVNIEYSGEAALEYKYPKNIIAFSAPEKLSKKFKDSGIISEFTAFENKPNESEVTIALISFASAS